MKFNIILLILVFAASTVLLVGRALDATWAGGSGSGDHLSVYADGVEYKRGETIETGDGEWLAVDINGNIVYLSERTNITLVDTRIGFETINVVQGRVVINGDVTVTTRELKTMVSGAASFVHYSWENNIEVAAIRGMAQISEAGIAVEEGQAVTLSTIPPYNPAFRDFDPERSTEKEFYEWVLPIVTK